MGYGTNESCNMSALIGTALLGLRGGISRTLRAKTARQYIQERQELQKRINYCIRAIQEDNYPSIPAKLFKELAKNEVVYAQSLLVDLDSKIRKSIKVVK